MTPCLAWVILYYMAYRIQNRPLTPTSTFPSMANNFCGVTNWRNPVGKKYCNCPNICDTARLNTVEMISCVKRNGCELSRQFRNQVLIFRCMMSNYLGVQIIEHSQFEFFWFWFFSVMNLKVNSLSSEIYWKQRCSNKRIFFFGNAILCQEGKDKCRKKHIGVEFVAQKEVPLFVTNGFSTRSRGHIDQFETMHKSSSFVFPSMGTL